MIVRRIRKFEEVDTSRKRTGRLLYAIQPSAIPLPPPDFEWREDLAFTEEAELRTQPGLTPVFDYVREHGHAIVEPAD